jgi:hypothetical protein
MCTSFWYGHWQPLTWLSCALDYTFWKQNPHGWHATNLLLHMANAVLVYFLCLASLKCERSSRGLLFNHICPGVGTDSPQRVEGYAALAALFWAVHPLRVESAAWLATRGYLLCTTFCLLTVLFYLQAVKQNRYPVAALFCFTLATFTKGIGMMLPLVLLLIDWVSFRRITSVRTAFFCAVEKIPFFAFSLLAGVTNFFAKQADGGMASLERYGLSERFGWVLYGIWFYLLKVISPLHLSPLYVKRPEIGAIMAVLVLTAVTSIFLFLFRRKLRPMIAGLSAFLLLIFPMLGFTQSGMQLFADRFTYLATIPFSILLTSVLINLPVMRRTISCTLAMLILIFGAQTFFYSRIWSNSLSLWNHAVSLDENNAKAHNQLGLELRNFGAYEKAIECFDKALKIRPDYADALCNRAIINLHAGKYEKTRCDIDHALTYNQLNKRDLARMLFVRGLALENLNKTDLAIVDYSSVIENQQVEPEFRLKALKARARLRLVAGDTYAARTDLAAILMLPDPSGELHRIAEQFLHALKPGSSANDPSR